MNDILTLGELDDLLSDDRADILVGGDRVYALLTDGRLYEWQGKEYVRIEYDENVTLENV